MSPRFFSTSTDEIPEANIRGVENDDVNKNEVTAPSTEKIVGKTTSHEFQAHTKKILDIVARSLYSDREVFLREIISNSSDALEKLRFKQLQNESITDPEQELHINIYVNKEDNTITIQDTGIGMSDQDLINNLGTIARSGSEEFISQFGEDKKAGDIIGQFGVGFYSVFMIGNQVEVFSRSAEPNSKGYHWSSDGSGNYQIAEAEGVARGTKVIIHVREDAKQFLDPERIKEVVRKYSNFVGFDINLNGEQINVVRPLWSLPKDKVTADEHKQFYQFISNSFDAPHYNYHFNIETPFAVSVLLYVPSKHIEKYGVGKLEPGVSIYSRKVLIQRNSKSILPEFLRFIKGVVDSPDLPLNLSREHFQDNLLIKRLSTLITKRFLKFLNEEAVHDREKYTKFFEEFGNFLKEGICSDVEWKRDLSKLLLSESSKLETGKMTTLDEYISRMKPDQKDIYFLSITNRKNAEISPYFETYKKEDLEVLFLYSPLDDFVMSHLLDYNGKKLVSIETSRGDEAITTKEEFKPFLDWFQEAVNNEVKEIRLTSRLVNSPAIIVDQQSASFRRMMKFVEPERVPKLTKQVLEINPDHPIITKLQTIRAKNPDVAKEIAKQILDNSLVAAGLLDDPRSMVSRVNILMEAALSKPETK
eukprot:TRINITY_DN10469_c0_g1_i1.p1 TRINITY_DN10469_c0_g1~~TRINITY_DN10469_c0_g1_i1.p1  ORF type:complete len:698 (+),score=155.80 TRINITY_DN10469_c0_g1_i1:155-2095(+)